MQYLTRIMMTNQKELKNITKKGRPKTNPKSRSEQLRKNSENYRSREAQKKRDLKNKVNSIIMPNLAVAISLLADTSITRGSRIEQVIKLLKLTTKQWDQEIQVSRHKGEIQTYKEILKNK